MFKVCGRGVLLGLLLVAAPALAVAEGDAGAESALRATVQAWAAAWTRLDADAYLQHYASTFEPPDNLSRAAWDSQRRQRLKPPAKISVQVDWLGASLREDGSAEARFIQRYSSATYSDQVLKTLSMIQEGGEWKIRRESSAAVTEQARAEVARVAAAEAAVIKAPAATPPAQPAPAVAEAVPAAPASAPAEVAKEPTPAVPPAVPKESAPAVSPEAPKEPAPAAAAVPPAAMPTDEEGKDLYAQLQRTLLSYDMNHVHKFLIDIHFMPAFAMSGYRQMLQWSAAYPAGHARRDDLVGLVREGMEAVVRYSAAGVPLAGWKGAGAGQPIGLIYGRSTPRYAQRPDPAKAETLRWNTVEMLRQASPASIGESLSAKALSILQDHSPAGQGFAPLLLASALAELDLVSNRLFLQQQLGPAAKGAYVPELVEVDEQGTWKALQAQSRLESQAILLQGLVHMHQLLSQANAAAFFAAGPVQGKTQADWQALVYRTLTAVYEGLVERHWDGAARSFVSEHEPQKGRGNKLALEDAMVVMEALQALSRHLPADDALAKTAREKLLAQGDFLRAGLTASPAAVPAGFMVANKAPYKALMPNVVQYVAAMSILLMADEAAGRHDAQATVTALYEAMRKLFWSEQVGVYRIASGFAVSAYDGPTFGALLRWQQHMQTALPTLGDFEVQTDNLIKVVLKGGSLIQSEGPTNGEPLSPEELIARKVPAVVEELKGLAVGERRTRLSQFIIQCADQDGDGIPGWRYADEINGGAPVMIGQTSVSTPFKTPEGTMPRL